MLSGDPGTLFTVGWYVTIRATRKCLESDTNGQFQLFKEPEELHPIGRLEVLRGALACLTCVGDAGGPSEHPRKQTLLIRYW